jgi:DNA topoisomerase IA
MDENFKKQIANDFGLMGMDTPAQERMIERIGNMLFEAVVERSVDIMDEKAINDFESLMDSIGQDYQRVISFLKERVPDFQALVSDEMARLKRATSGIFA